MHRPAVFLDRDNTIIHNDGDLGDPARVRLVQGAASAIASLNGLGFRVVVVTNQGGVARGKYGEDDVERVHHRISELLQQQANGARVERYYFCPYHPEGRVAKYTMEHEFRKPSPGMLLQAAKDLRLDLPPSWMVGDALRDVEAGRAAGCRTVLLRDDAPLLDPKSTLDAAKAVMDQMLDEEAAARADDAAEVRPDYLARNIVEAVRIIAQARNKVEAPEPRRAGGVKARRSPSQSARGERVTPTDAYGDDEEDRPDTSDGESGDQLDPREEPAPPPPKVASTRPARPFRPWGAASPPVDRHEAERVWDRVTPGNAESAVGEVHRTGPGETRPTEPRPATRDTSPQVAPPPHAEPPSPPPAPTHRPPVDSPPKDDPHHDDEPPAIIADDVSDLLARASIDAETRDASNGAAPPPLRLSTQGEQTLRLILQELRSQRGMHGEFSYLTVLAIVLQALALLCILGALWMAAGDDELFIRWAFAGLMTQLATLAMLLFARAGG